MTEFPTIAENWQEDEPPAYRKVRAVREATPGCPCDRCVSKDTCRVTGHECAGYLRWVKTGTTKEEVK